MKENGSLVEAFKPSRLRKILTLPIFVFFVGLSGFESCFDLVLF